MIRLLGLLLVILAFAMIDLRASPDSPPGPSMEISYIETNDSTPAAGPATLAMFAVLPTTWRPRLASTYAKKRARDAHKRLHNSRYSRMDGAHRARNGPI